MKPIVVTCMYGRPMISELFLDNMERLGLEVVAAVSDRSSMGVCEGRCRSFLYYNDPLGAKFNAAVEVALRDKSWTHLIISGDDDLYSDEFLNRIEEFQDLPYIGLGSLYWADLVHEKGLHFRYTDPVAVGSGKVLHRSVVEQMGKLFSDEVQRNLDFDLDMRLYEYLYKPFIMDTDRTMMVDLKSNVNMWKFDNFRELGRECGLDVALSILTEKEREKIYACSRLLRGVSKSGY